MSGHPLDFLPPICGTAEVLLVARVKSRATLDRHIKNGSFPAPVKCGPRLNGWPRPTLISWYDGLLPAAAA